MQWVHLRKYHPSRTKGGKPLHQKAQVSKTLLGLSIGTFIVSHPGPYSLQALEQDINSITEVAWNDYIKLGIISLLMLPHFKPLKLLAHWPHVDIKWKRRPNIAASHKWRAGLFTAINTLLLITNMATF